MSEYTKILVLDAEIENAIHKKGEEIHPGIKYCNGWRDFQGMGLTVVGGWQSISNRFRTFGSGRNLTGLQEAIDESDYVMTFNGISFDGPLLAEHGAVIPDEKHLDLLVLIWEAHRLGAKFNPSSHGGYGLDACAKANSLPGKTGNGALAPVWWQQGRYCEVIDYCLQDVWITTQLLCKATAGQLVSPKTGQRIHLKLPPMTFPLL